MGIGKIFFRTYCSNHRYGKSLKLLSYALLAVFIYGGSSILQKLLALNTSITYIGAWCIIISILILLLPIIIHLKLVDYINRVLFNRIAYNNCNFSYWTWFYDSVG
ncbi:aromatic amino acid transport family protein [Rickettsia rhipicephali]|uniref:aromatic amino acid transport family protein n=1 Tax=Rickettsia rhipicephali TaxID=33992 RepID=UPI002B1CAE10|nr:aromatic amino acid transport family protein [Rickettsia rhipicephali]